MVTRGKLYADEIYVYVRNKAGACENVWKDAYTRHAYVKRDLQNECFDKSQRSLRLNS